MALHSLEITLHYNCKIRQELKLFHYFKVNQLSRSQVKKAKVKIFKTKKLIWKHIYKPWNGYKIQFYNFSHKIQDFYAPKDVNLYHWHAYDNFCYCWNGGKICVQYGFSYLFFIYYSVIYFCFTIINLLIYMLFL